MRIVSIVCMIAFILGLQSCVTTPHQKNCNQFNYPDKKMVEHTRVFNGTNSILLDDYFTKDELIPNHVYNVRISFQLPPNTINNPNLKFSFVILLATGMNFVYDDPNQLIHIDIPNHRPFFGFDTDESHMLSPGSICDVSGSFTVPSIWEHTKPSLYCVMVPILQEVVSDGVTKWTPYNIPDLKNVTFLNIELEDTECSKEARLPSSQGVVIIDDRLQDFLDAQQNALNNSSSSIIGGIVSK